MAKRPTFTVGQVGIGILLALLIVIGADAARWQNRAILLERSIGSDAAQQLIKSNGHASEQNYNTQPEPYDLEIKALTFLLGCATLGILCFQAWIYWKQRGIMSGQLEAVIEQSKLARAEFNATHRPKLILRQAFSLISDPLEGPIVVQYIITNIGESRCWMTEAHLGIELVIDPAYPIFLMTPDMSFPNNVPYIGPIAPGESKRLNFQDTNHRWDERHRTNWIAPRGVHFVGHIAYIDAPGSSIVRHTAFRRWYDRRSQRFRVLQSLDGEHEYAD